MTTQLVFEAKLTGAKPILAKSSQNYGGGTNGRLELTLTLEMPKPPAAPHRPQPDYEWITSGDGYAMKPRPGDQTRTKGESDEDYEAREAVVKRREQQAHWDASKARFDRKLADYAQAQANYQAAQAGHRDRVMSYAQLVGITAVFGDTPVRVEITPLDQDLLPGFSASLLAEPVAPPVVEALPGAAAREIDDQAFDEEDE